APRSAPSCVWWWTPARFSRPTHSADWRTLWSTWPSTGRGGFRGRTSSTSWSGPACVSVRTDTARLLATALDILEDWAHGITFDTAEVRKERGVVIEEWRTGRDASTRVSYRQFPVMLNGSKYAERIPIGTRENLESFAPALAVQFYRDWYRPDLMSVVAVGDFDADSMVAAIGARFGAIPMPVGAAPRLLAPVPDHAGTYVSIESDKEYPGKDVTLLWLMPHTEQKTV